jgi:hypothetical protein
MSLTGDVLARPVSSVAPNVHVQDGFYVEEGRDGGCKEIEGGGLIEASSWKGINLQGL